MSAGLAKNSWKPLTPAAAMSAGTSRSKPWTRLFLASVSTLYDARSSTVPATGANLLVGNEPSDLASLALAALLLANFRKRRASALFFACAATWKVSVGAASDGGWPLSMVGEGS